MSDDKDLEEFEAFAKEFQNESDRAAVILGAAKLDAMLYQVLQNALTPSSGNDELLEGDAPLGNFSARTLMCFRLGLIDRDLKSALDIVRRIRNSYAHEWSGLTLDAGAHRERIRALVAPMRGYSGFKFFLKEYFSDGTSASELRSAVGVINVRLLGLCKLGHTVTPDRPWSLLPPE